MQGSGEFQTSQELKLIRAPSNVSLHRYIHSVYRLSIIFDIHLEMF
jgi:hypothetical protein